MTNGPVALVSSFELPLALDDQLAWLKVEQGCRIYLCSLIPPGELLDFTFSFPNVVAAQPLEPLNNAANFSEIGFFLVRSQLIGQELQSWDGHAW